MPIRKNRNLLTNIDDIDKKSAFTNYHEYSEDIEITKAVKLDVKNSSSNSIAKDIEIVKEVFKIE